MKLFKSAILYFSLVFGAGFILGTFRVLWHWFTLMGKIDETP